jgi:hypothetical protein
MAEQTAPVTDETGVDQGATENTNGGGDANDALLTHLQEMSGKLDQLIPPAGQGPTFGQVTDPTFDPYEPFESYEAEDFGQQQEPQYEQQQQGMSQEQAMQWLQSEIDRGVQTAVSPFMAQQRARELESQYPDLARPEVVQAIAPVAQRLAASMGLGQDAWRNPDFLATVYQAQQAQQTASQQTAPEDQQPGEGLERGGAGAPGANDEPNVAERILAAYPHGGAAQFWGA